MSAAPQTMEYDKYDSPEALANDNSLTHTQKLSLLESWAEDREALARATAEGMEGGEDAQLRDIEKLIVRLKEDS